jgi:hypothetical protein
MFRSLLICTRSLSCQAADAELEILDREGEAPEF